MNRITIALLLTAVLSLSLSELVAQSKKSKKKSDKNQKEQTMAPPIAEMDVYKKASYAIGVNVANDLKQNGIDFDPAIMMQALVDVHKGDSLKLSESQMGEVLQELQTMLQEKEQRKSDSMSKIGIDFLQQNKTKEGVQVTESGLQYKVITLGTGAKPLATDQVTVHYRGTKIDGTQFDSSYDRGQPATFGLNQVIKGWTEGVQLMPVGSKFMFYIPSELAYGRNAPPSIGPNQVLIFEVELLDIAK